MANKPRKTISKTKHKSNAILDRYWTTKTWESSKHSIFDQEEINYRIMNDLPVSDLYAERDAKFIRTGKYKGQFKKDKKNGKENL